MTIASPKRVCVLEQAEAHVLASRVREVLDAP